MEAGNPLLDDYVLSLTGAPSARGSASCPRPAATPTTTSCASTARSTPGAASHRTSPCSAATTARRLPRAPARAGPDLRGRRQRPESAGRLARARHRRRAARGLGGGVVLCGVSAGSLCWFAEGVTAFHGTARPTPGSESCPGATRSTTTPSAGGPTSTAGGCWTACGPATRPRTAPRCTSSASGCTGWWRRGRAARAFRMRAGRQRAGRAQGAAAASTSAVPTRAVRAEPRAAGGPRARRRCAAAR